MIGVDGVDAQVERSLDPRSGVRVPGPRAQTRRAGPGDEPRRPVPPGHVEDVDAKPGEGAQARVEPLRHAPRSGRMDEADRGARPTETSEEIEVVRAQPATFKRPELVRDPEQRLGHLGMLDVDREGQTCPDREVAVAERGHVVLGQLRRRPAPHEDAAIAPPDGRVVDEDGHPVGGQPAVGLDAGRAQLDGQPKGGERILRGPAGGPTMGEQYRPFGAGQPLGPRQPLGAGWQALVGVVHG